MILLVLRSAVEATIQIYLSGGLQESLSEPRDAPADGPIVEVVRVSVHVPLHSLFHDVQVVRGIEITRPRVSKSEKSVEIFYHSLLNNMKCE